MTRELRDTQEIQGKVKPETRSPDYRMFRSPTTPGLPPLTLLQNKGRSWRNHQLQELEESPRATRALAEISTSGITVSANSKQSLTPSLLT